MRMPMVDEGIALENSRRTCIELVDPYPFATDPVLSTFVLVDFQSFFCLLNIQ
jgi:hypothetical protein